MSIIVQIINRLVTILMWGFTGFVIHLTMDKPIALHFIATAIFVYISFWCLLVDYDAYKKREME